MSRTPRGHAASACARRLLALALSCSAVGSEALTAQRPCGDSTRVAWTPATLRPGRLVLITVSPGLDGVQYGGIIGGEALHFAPGPAGSAQSFGAIEIEAVDSVWGVITCTRGERTDTIGVALPVGRAPYPVERLRVDPAFASKPDAALAARIERESRRAAEVAALSHATPRLWSESWILPREARITSGFGIGRVYNGALTSRHMGTDFAGAKGTPIRAANRGVARIVDAFYYGGNVVYLDHGDGLTTAYLHLSAHAVAEGDTVSRGQLIGETGATGRVTGPHLHLIARYGSTSVDPLSLFALAGDSVAQRRVAQASVAPKRAPSRRSPAPRRSTRKAKR